MSPTTFSRRDISPELVLVDPELRRVAQLLLPDPGSLGRVRATAPAAAPSRASSPAAPLARTSRARSARKRARLATGVAAVLVVAWASAAGPAGQRPILIDAELPSAPTPAMALDERLALVLPPVRIQPRPRVARQPAKASATVGRTGAPQPKGAAAGKERPKAAAAGKTTATAEPATAQRAQRPARPAQPTAERGTQQKGGRTRSPRPGGRARTPVVTVQPLEASLAWEAVEGATYYNVIIWREGERLLDLWPSRNLVLVPSRWTYEGKSIRLLPGRYLWFAYPGFGTRAEGRYGEPAQSGILVVDRK